MADETNSGTETGKRSISPLTWRLLILFFVVAVLLFDVNRPPPPESWSWVWIGKKLWHMPGGIGALIGTFFGLLGGFTTLIAAQKRQAKLDLKTELDRIEQDKQCLAAGLCGELRSMRNNCEMQIESMRDTAARMAKRAKDEKARKKEFPMDIAPITERAFFKANAGKLGLLGADLVNTVTTIYEHFMFWQHEGEEKLTVTPKKQAKFLPKFADNIETMIPDITNLIRRLEAIERGLPDPGPGSG